VAVVVVTWVRWVGTIFGNGGVVALVGVWVRWQRSADAGDEEA